MVGTDVSFNFNYEIGSSPISVRALLFGRCPGFALCPAVMLSIKMEMNLEDWWNDTDGGTEILRQKIVTVPLRPQMSHRLNWDRTRASAMRGRRLAGRLSWHGLYLFTVQYSNPFPTSQRTHSVSIMRHKAVNTV